jgi:hypothetical protein
MNPALQVPSAQHPHPSSPQQSDLSSEQPKENSHKLDTPKKIIHSLFIKNLLDQFLLLVIPYHIKRVRKKNPKLASNYTQMFIFLRNINFLHLELKRMGFATPVCTLGGGSS